MEAIVTLSITRKSPIKKTIFREYKISSNLNKWKDCMIDMINKAKFAFACEYINIDCKVAEFSNLEQCKPFLKGINISVKEVKRSD